MTSREFTPTNGDATLTPEQVVMLDEVILALDIRGVPSPYLSMARCDGGRADDVPTLKYMLDWDGLGFVEWYDGRWHAFDGFPHGWVEVFTGSVS